MRFPLILGLAPSRRLGWLLAGFCATLGGGVFILPAPNPGLRLLYGLAWGLICGWVGWEKRKREASWLGELRLEKNGNLDWRPSPREDFQPVDLHLGSCTLWSWILLLRCRREGQKQAAWLVLLADSLVEKKTGFRQLQLWLRWRKPEP